MTIYDAAMVGMLIAGMVWGAMRGITWQLAGFASLVLGYAVAFPLSGELAGHFPGEPVVARGLSMLVVYVAVSGGVYLAAWLVRATLKKMKFEAFDRHLGMILGGAQGALLGVVATVFVVSLAPSSREPILTSPSGRVVSRCLDAVQPVLPGELRTALAPFWGQGPEAGPGRRLAGVDAHVDGRFDRIPDDSRAALDWFQEALPGPDAPRRGTVPAPGPLVNEWGTDPSLVRSVLELGVQQAQQHLGGRDAAPMPSQQPQAPPRRDDSGQAYWWEHGRDARHR